MDNDKIIAYLLENERKRYEHAKEFQKTLRWLGIMLLLCATVVACCYMYFVVPAEEVTVDGNSKAAIHTVVDNGSELWQ